MFSFHSCGACVASVAITSSASKPSAVMTGIASASRTSWIRLIWPLNASGVDVRFALYSVSDTSESSGSEAADPPTKPVAVRQPKRSASKSTVPQPAVAADLDYPALTLAQLRARLQSLDVDELEALLAYEQATKARAPFETLLANRITRANAK